jgi:putative thioredoxin
MAQIGPSFERQAAVPVLGLTVCSLLGHGRARSMSVDTPILSEGGDSDLVKNTTTNDFMRDVIDASREVPVLVDFWAPWCGPCRQLTPILERTVRAAKGAVKLVKLNIDDHPQIPGQMGIQSIPAVFAFQDGRPVDGFMGALPESRVKAFIARLIGDSAADEGAGLEAAEAALAAGDVNTAAQSFGEILQKDAENAQAAAGLAKCYIKTGDLVRAEQTLAFVPPAKADSAPVASARAALELAHKGGEAGDVEALRSKLASNPKDAQARFDLALALNAKGDRNGALDELLTLVARDRTWNEDAARKQLLQLFDAWGPSDPATISGRQRLSSLLFA